MSEEKNKKELRRQAARRASLWRQVRNWTIAVVILGLAGYGLVLLTQIGGPEGEDLSQRVPVMGDLTHIPEGQSQAVEYNSNPPTSGPHYAQTAQYGFRAEPIPDGHIIHNLEHGDVWISYHPDIPEAVKS